MLKPPQRQRLHHAMGMLLFSNSREDDVEIDGAKFRRVLEENHLEAAEDLELLWMYTFQQDNNPSTTTSSTMEWFRLLVCASNVQ